MRIFVGIGLESPVREKIGEAQRHLKTAQADVRWVAEDNLHLTIHFCGEVSSVQKDEIIDICREIARNFQPFLLEIKYLSVFPPFGDPRLIWTGVEKGREEAITLIEVAKRHLTLVTGNSEKKDISPHVTIGRVRTEKNIAVLTTYLHKLAMNDFGSQTIDKLTVFESVLQPTGPHYTVLDAIPLGMARK